MIPLYSAINFEHRLLSPNYTSILVPFSILLTRIKYKHNPFLSPVIPLRIRPDILPFPNLEIQPHHPLPTLIYILNFHALL